MKILLREYESEVYKWVTAKYNEGHFVVNGNKQNWHNIVAVVNDNRKNYIQCSSCGKVFKKGDPKFEEHKANAVKPNVCFNCHHLSYYDECIVKSRLFIRPDGSIGEKVEKDIIFKCAMGRGWFSPNICSEEAINNCPKRQCANATEIEIDDFFTEYPGVFDDIITIDRLLDDGYDVVIRDHRETCCEFAIDDNYTVGAVINHIGIIDRFFIWWGGDKYTVYYSKKYDKLFTHGSKGYITFDPWDMFDETLNEIKSAIKKLYY